MWKVKSRPAHTRARSWDNGLVCAAFYVRFLPREAETGRKMQRTRELSCRHDRPLAQLRALVCAGPVHVVYNTLFIVKYKTIIILIDVNRIFRASIFSLHTQDEFFCQSERSAGNSKGKFACFPSGTSFPIKTFGFEKIALLFRCRLHAMHSSFVKPDKYSSMVEADGKFPENWKNRRRHLWRRV